MTAADREALEVRAADAAEREAICVESGVPIERARSIAACERRMADSHWASHGCVCGAHRSGITRAGSVGRTPERERER